MAKYDGSVIINTQINTDGVEKGAKTIADQMEGIMDAVKKVGAVIGTAFAVDGIVEFGKEALNAASDLQEVQNVVDVTFPQMSAQVNQFAKDAAKSAGLSETMAKEYSGTFGTMAKAMGFTESEAYELSTALTQFTGDLASFRNLSQDEAFNKLQAIFTGETESLKALGVVMTQTNLDAFALANGFGKTTDEMTEQEKVALRYQYVMDQLSAAQGDYARTSDSWANQTKNFQLQMENLKTTIGSGLIELLTPALQNINDVILPKLLEVGGEVSTWLTNVSQWIQDNEPLIAAVTATVGAFTAAWVVTEMATWIINAGGVVKIVKDMTAAFKASTVAKLADKAVDLQIIGLYALDYIKALGGTIAKIGANTAAVVAHTAAQWAQVAATTAWNAICSVATAVTTAFGAAVAFLTSPIGLVILAIGALIAIVALLVANWEEVKATAEVVWAGIKAVWSAVAYWFKSNVIDPVVDFFRGMGERIRGIWDSIIGGIRDAINGVIEFFNSIFGGGSVTVNATTTGGPTPTSYVAPTAYALPSSVPYLASGAVIPPKSPFVAVLGDQKHGTNIEAPLSTIQEALRAELGGNGLLSTLQEQNELLRQILANSGVYLDGERISKTVTNYQRRSARAGGY